MWIAACDDDVQFTGYLSEVFPKVVSENDRVSVFNSGMQLLDAIQQERLSPDVLFLDMDMPGLSGLETASEFCAISESTFIVALTQFKGYSFNCYQKQIPRYLLKPSNPAQLKEIIDEVRLKSASRDTLRILTKEQIAFIEYSDILYLESGGRSLDIYTSQNVYPCPRSITQIAEELENKGFYRIHKSYIVNMAHVCRVDRSDKKVHLTDGRKLPVSNRRQTDFINTLQLYRLGA